ncbi:hypothetical protein B0T24DRAFT_389221 [Lasiosphaeria ovina]|uniref:Uncharacterized protein n=1 Tax=Lasiosphaeria ovina TaxID=92902 RepID=A0AAE0JZQ6_9PEZI|nr:hypothetical protein B0T24DRAFT_389221 [Lasiosphaeria ovina]
MNGELLESQSSKVGKISTLIPFRSSPVGPRILVTPPIAMLGDLNVSLREINNRELNNRHLQFNPFLKCVASAILVRIDQHLARGCRGDAQYGPCRATETRGALGGVPPPEIASSSIIVCCWRDVSGQFHVYKAQQTRSTNSPVPSGSFFFNSRRSAAELRRAAGFQFDCTYLPVLCCPSCQAAPNSRSTGQQIASGLCET